MSETKNIGHYAHTKSVQLDRYGETVSKPLKIVFLGAGSGFFQRLFIDVLSIPGADSGTMAIVDIDDRRLEMAHRLALKINETMNKQWSVETASDYRQVLGGADYIINCIEVSGLGAVKSDNDIPARYGVMQCIGDTAGPGGLFKALRTGRVFIDILGEIEKRCPHALLLNYTNPMSILCLIARRCSTVRVLGLCHSVQGSGHKLAEYLSIPYEQMRWVCAGINHLAWFTVLEHRGVNLYPELCRKIQDDNALYEQDPVRFDMMQHFGYFVTESSGHFSEYVPYYRKRQDLIDRHCRLGYLGETGFYAANWPTWRKNNDDRRRDILEGKTELTPERSWEYASYIIQAIETNKPLIVHATVPNRGLIDNLSLNGVVEAACVVDRSGVSPTVFGTLPPQCAALCEAHMRMYDLAATACLQRSREAAFHALAMDPLTAAVCSLAEIKQMTSELFESQRDLLPDF